MWPAERHYLIDPMADLTMPLSREEQERILGGEACMWTEFVSPENIDSRIWPRAAAVAERLWSPQEVRDVDSMYRRMDAVSWHLEGLGLTHRSSVTAMLARLAGTDDIAALRVLADVVEPVKDYTRLELANKSGVALSIEDPLNRLVDAVPPESEAARKFALAVNTLVSSKFRDADSKAQVRAQLVSWSNNHTRLQPLLEKSYLLKEAAPLSQELASLGGAGLQALDNIDRNKPAMESWKADQLAMLEEAQKPKADLLLVVASAVRKLIDTR
jgi:hexosaminidase